MKINQSTNHFLLIPILFIAAVLRLYGLDRLSLWADELWVVMDSTRGNTWEMLTWVYGHDNHPPGYYFFIRYWQFIFGSSDFSIRLPSMIAGVALVAATYMAGRKHYSQTAALIAATLVAGSYQAIYYSQEARPNIFMALYALLAFYYFCEIILAGDQSLKNKILFWLSATLASYFHYAGLVFCLCLGLIYFVFAIITCQKDSFVVGIKLFVPVLLAYLPWLAGFTHHLISTPVTAWQRTPDFNTLKTTIWFLFGPDSFRVMFYQVVFVGSVFVIGRGIFNGLNGNRDADSLGKKSIFIFYTLAMIVCPVGVFFIKSIFYQDAYNHRHFLYVIPLMALLAGYLIHEIIKMFPNKKQTVILISMVIFIIVYQFVANNERALYTANHFKQEFREGAQVVSEDLPFINSTNGIIVSNIYFFDHYLEKFTAGHRKSDYIYDQAQNITDLRSRLAAGHVGEFYYLEAPIVPGANKMLTAEDMALLDYYTPLCRTKFLRVQIFKFSAQENLSKANLLALPACP